MTAPFLKWVGGKRTLTPTLAAVHREFNNYFEPFMGAAALFYHLYDSNVLAGKQVTLSDLNQRLVITHQAVRDQPEEVIQFLEEHQRQHSKDYYYATRANLPRQHTQLAAWMIYLNRTGFNGLYRVNSKGKFNVPMGSYKNPNIVRREYIQAASEALQGVQIRYQSYKEIEHTVQRGDLVYFDPPYVPLSKSSHFTAYTGVGFDEEDQEQLAAFAKKLHVRGVKLILSNHDVPVVRELYRDDAFRIQVVPMRRPVNSKADRRGAVNELVIHNNPAYTE